MSKIARRFDFSLRSTVAVWLYALLLPLPIVLLTQFPLCHVAFLSAFFKGLPPFTSMLILSVVFLGPSYGLVLYAFKSIKRKLLHAIVLTVVFAAYLPLLWVFGFYTSRILFESCVTV